jgi:hypothetical protein
MEMGTWASQTDMESHATKVAQRENMIIWRANENIPTPSYDQYDHTVTNNNEQGQVVSNPIVNELENLDRIDNSDLRADASPSEHVQTQSLSADSDIAWMQNIDPTAADWDHDLPSPSMITRVLPPQVPSPHATNNLAASSFQQPGFQQSPRPGISNQHPTFHNTISGTAFQQAPLQQENSQQVLPQMGYQQARIKNPALRHQVPNPVSVSSYPPNQPLGHTSAPELYDPQTLDQEDDTEEEVTDDDYHSHRIQLPTTKLPIPKHSSPKRIRTDNGGYSIPVPQMQGSRAQNMRNQLQAQNQLFVRQAQSQPDLRIPPPLRPKRRQTESQSRYGTRMKTARQQQHP